MNISPVNNNPKQQAFGMRVSHVANFYLSHYSPSVSNPKTLVALDALKNTAQNNYELSRAVISSKMGWLGNYPVYFEVKDLAESSTVVIKKFWARSIPKTLNRLRDDSYVAKLFENAKAKNNI